MPRIPRDVPADSIVHLLSRGVERRPIFLRAEDYAVFLSLLRDAFKAHAIAILNYVLMPNHFHIQALTGNVPVGIAMHQVLTRYSLYFNHVYGRVGHLFQSRYKSFLCRDDAYLVQLPVYLSLNPVRARLAARPSEWEWSGHNELVSKVHRFIDLSRLEDVSGISPEDWRVSYLDLITKGIPTLDLSSGLDEILHVASLQAGISLRDMLAGTRGEPFTKAKRFFAREALKRGFLQTQIAKKLGCAPASLADLLSD